MQSAAKDTFMEGADYNMPTVYYDDNIIFMSLIEGYVIYGNHGFHTTPNYSQRSMNHHLVLSQIRFKIATLRGSMLSL